MRLGHGEGRAHLTVDDGLEPFVFLRGRAGARQEIHVAVVGRHAMDRERTEDRARRLLVDRRPGNDWQPHAAVFLGRLRRPQAGFLGFLAHGRQPRRGDVLVVGEIGRIGFERQHVLLDEGAYAQADGFDLGRQREVHGCFPYPEIITTCPPSTTMVAPVMKLPASEASKSSAPSRSPSLPKRPAGIARLSASPASPARNLSLISVTNQPGAMALTRTPLNASSTASALVTCTTAALAVA